MEEEKVWLISEYIEMLQEVMEESGDLPVTWVYDGHDCFNEEPHVSSIDPKEIVLFMS